MGWPASNNDITMFKTCSLFNTEEKKEYFKSNYGYIISDQGFFDSKNLLVITPIANRKGTKASINRWNQLNAKEKKWSARVSAIEARIENTFSQIFARKYKLIKRRDPLCRNPKETHTKIIKAAVILYNLEVLHGITTTFQDSYPDV